MEMKIFKRAKNMGIGMGNFSFVLKTRAWFLTSFAIICLTASPIQGARAQTSDQVKMSQVMSIVSSYLLAGREEPIEEPQGSRVDIDLNQLLPATYTVTDAIYAAFELQEEGAELCFDISSNNGPLNPGDIFVQINGKPAPVSEGADNCYVLLEQDQRLINYVLISVVGAGVSVDVDRIELTPATQTQLALPIVTRGGWSERAVRKVLKVFAFGGHATNAQILEWADMYPQDAIQEMLTFDEHNLKLSPLAVGETYTDTATDHGTFLGFQNFISSESSNIPIPADRRDQYGLDGYNFDDAYGRMITVRGLNPFRQRIGFWETNYHLAVNRDASVDRDQIAAYYDLIMEAHEAGLPYHEVMAIAAKSAAIAEQYGHDRNQWVLDSGEYICNCNDDFAREIHQLFYGIFGANDPYHEDGTIRETAKMLTDMPIDNSDGPLDNIQVVFGTNRHHTDDLTILGHTITGANASEKIDNLMPVSIQHPESLANLPVMIISVLADDNLSEYSKNRLRVSWASMGPNKDFLEFIQTYAISALFHSRNQHKYFTSHERALYLANKNNLDNLEAYFGGGSYSGRAGRSVGGLISDDGAGDFFRPLHNVFGGQSSLEASDSALSFENNYNTLTQDEYRMRDNVQCNTCDLGQPWEKKWETVLPQRADGEFYVEDVARWLWNHAVGNFDNYTELEKAHLFSLLGAARIDTRSNANSDGQHPLDFNLLMCMVEDYRIQEGNVNVEAMLNRDIWDRYCRHGDEGLSGYSAVEIAAINRVHTSQTIAANPVAQDVLAQLAAMTLPLNATTGELGGATTRRHARQRINNALGFIFTTPFVFAEGQK